MFAAYAFLSGQYEKQLWLVLGVLAAIPAVVQGHGANSPPMQES
jgi:hypothetical protein